MFKDFTNQSGQRIGWLKDGIFRKRVSRKKHLMKKMNAWGIDSDVVRQLNDLGCTEIRVLDNDTNYVYAVSLDVFNEKAIPFDFVGPQLFLPIRYWDSYKRDDDR